MPLSSFVDTGHVLHSNSLLNPLIFQISSLNRAISIPPPHPFTVEQFIHSSFAHPLLFSQIAQLIIASIQYADLLSNVGARINLFFLSSVCLTSVLSGACIVDF